MQVVARQSRTRLLVEEGDGYSARVLDLRDRELSEPWPLGQVLKQGGWRPHHSLLPMPLLMVGVRRHEWPAEVQASYERRRTNALEAHGPHRFNAQRSSADAGSTGETTTSTVSEERLARSA